MAGSVHTEGLSKRLYDALANDYPDHRDDRRPVHAVGIGAVGYFEPSMVASDYTIAEHFQGGRIPVTVRFSNGSGSPVERDHDLDVRGMATKFHLPSGADTDLIMITLSVFFASTTDEFLGFSEAGVPEPVKAESWWGKLRDMLRLRAPASPPEADNPESGAAGVLAYANRHLSVRPGTVAALLLVTPNSYARATYHALHTFKLTAPDGSVHYARFHWEAVAGVHPVAKATHSPDFLHAELRHRLAREPARFVLRMVLAGQGDPIDNPTVLWDTTRPRIVMGELVLTAMVPDQHEDCERLSFNPTRVVAGFECSDDPILAARRGAYEYSCRKRQGSGCPVGGDQW